MAIKKSELYSSLWQSCDELRGGMDASQYKDYVLTLLFVKYVSDKYAGDPRALILVPEGGSFDDMARLKGDKEIGDRINKIIGRLAEENDLKGVIDVADFNDEDKLGKGKEMVDRLSKLIAIFETIDLRANRADGDDLLGDAYEYLMRHFATESGKSKGQFYTPAEVSRILAKVIGVGKDTRQDQSVYDPTCGSGSLLLKVAHEAPRGLSIFGQEMDNATAALARMNMILHDAPTAEIWQGNTLANPHWKERDGSLKTFDYAVANPPFSYKAWSNGLDPEHDEYGRFEYGIPPAKNGDYAFLLHILKSLKSTGKGAVILPHGVLFRGGAEANIRRNLVRRGFIRGIIGLPANLFYGTGIPACILVLDKEHAAANADPQRGGIFMIDASKGFMKDGNKNRLRERDIHKIVDVFTSQKGLPRYARFAPLREIEANDYNLNIPRYIDSSEPEDLHDLHAHLSGGIPNRDIDALQDYWQVFPTLRHTLFAPAPVSPIPPVSPVGWVERSETQQPGQPTDPVGLRSANPTYSHPQVPPERIKPTILEHPEFAAFRERILERFHAWRDPHRPGLMGLNGDTEPKALIRELSEALLEQFESAPLIDPYAVYQHLMDYWAETMQDDVYAIVQDGWEAAARPRELVAEKGQKHKETPDLTIGRKKYKTDLIPPALIVARYFADEQRRIDQLQAEADAAAQALESHIEEHSGEDGLLEEAKTDKGKITRASLKARLAEIKGNPEFDDERQALQQCQKLIDAEAAANKMLKEAIKARDEAVLKHYAKLTEAEIKELVVDDKWLAALEQAVQGEIERVTQQLATRIKELEERYAEPLPEIMQEVESLQAKVDEHLHRMGLEWRGGA